MLAYNIIIMSCCILCIFF